MLCGPGSQRVGVRVPSSPGRATRSRLVRIPVCAPPVVFHQSRAMRIVRYAKGESVGYGCQREDGSIVAINGDALAGSGPLGPAPRAHGRRCRPPAGRSCCRARCTATRNAEPMRHLPEDEPRPRPALRQRVRGSVQPCAPATDAQMRMMAQGFMGERLRYKDLGVGRKHTESASAVASAMRGTHTRIGRTVCSVVPPVLRLFDTERFPMADPNEDNGHGKPATPEEVWGILRGLAQSRLFRYCAVFGGSLVVVVGTLFGRGYHVLVHKLFCYLDDGPALELELVDTVLLSRTTWSAYTAKDVGPSSAICSGMFPIYLLCISGWLRSGSSSASAAR